MQPHLKLGFSLISKASPEARQEFTRYVATSFGARGSIDPDRAIAIIGLDKNTIPDALSAVTVLVSAVLDIDVDTSDVISVGTGVLFDDDEIDVVTEITDYALSCKDTINSSAELGRLGNAVLPTFVGISGEIDVRMKFDDSNRVTAHTAVAVINVRNDSTDDVWFQANIHHIKSMIKLLTKIEARIESIKDIEVSQ